MEHSVDKLRLKVRSRAKKNFEAQQFGILEGQIYEQDDFSREIPWIIVLM